MNVRGGRNLFGKAAEQEIQKRKFREVPFAYPEHEEAEANTYKTTKSAPVQKVRRFEESDDSKAPSGLVTYPTIHINKNYERYLQQTGKPEDDNSKSVSRRTRSGTVEKSRSVSAVSFKIKSTEASVKLQNKTESFEILKSAYEDDEDDDITESSDNCDIDYASRSRGNDDNPVFKVPKAPTHSDPKVDMFKKLDPDTYDKISELLAQKELIEKQLKTIAEHGGDELPPVAIEKTEMYGSPRRKHKDPGERVDWGKNVREEDGPYERRVKGREITRSTGGTSRSCSDQYRSDREPERYYDLQRSDSSYTGADRQRVDPVPIRPASSMGSHSLDPGYSSEHSRGVTSSREIKDLHTLEREYQAFSETVGVNESSFSASSQISILKKSSDPSYRFDNSYSQQNLQPGYQNYNLAMITGQGLLPTPSSTGQSKSSYHTPQSSGQALMRTPETGHGLLPTPTSGVDQMQQFQSSFSSQGLLPTPNQKGNSLMPEPTVVEKPFDAIKKTLNLLNIKLSESSNTETGNEKGGAHLSGNNPPVSGPIDQAALDDISQSMLSAKRQLESLRNPGYDQTNQCGNPGKYKNVLPPEIRNIEHQHTDDYDFCEYDSWRDSRHAKYVEEVPHRRRDHQETDLDTDIYYRKETYSGRPDFESSREYDRRSRPSRDPYPPEHSERSRDYNPSSHDPFQPEQSERSQAYDPYELESERSEDYNPLPYDPYLPEHSERSQDYDRNRRLPNSFSREIFEGHKDDFESRNQHYNIDSNIRQQRFPSAERKTNQPPSLMSLQVLPTKNIGRSSKQPTADLQAPAMAKDQGWKENPSYRPSDNSDPDYNPYLDGDDDNEHSQETRAQTSDGKFRNRPSRFSQIDNQHQGRVYPAIDIPTESMAALPDRSERLPFIDRQHNREMGRDLNKFGETRPVPVSSSQHTDKLPGSNRKRKSRFEPAEDDYGYPDQQNPPPGHRNKLGREEGYSHGYSVETEPKWGSQAHSDIPPDSDSSALLNARGSLNDIFEEVANLPHPESRHGDFNINRTNHPTLIDFPHSAFDHTSAIDQPGFGPQTAKQPRIPGLQPPMRGLPDSNKPNFPRNDNREQNISRPFPPKYQNVDQPNVKPFPPYGREQLVPKPIPRPPPGRDVITGNINIKSQLVTSAESSKQRASELSANNNVPVKIPYDTGPSGRPNFKEGGQETLNRGKRPASNLTSNTEVSLAKQKKTGCVNCGSLDHIKCPKSRKIQIEGTPKYGEQHGLPNLSKPGQRRESSSQDNEGAGKITSIPTNIMFAPTKITSAPPKITSAPERIPSAPTKINPVPAKINTAPVKGDNPQDKNVQQYPEESRRCVDDLRSYLQNYKRNRSSMEPVSALTSASKAYSANLSYKDIIMITEGEPDKYSGALYAKQSIFLARGISDNKATIKETVYNMAVENLLNMTTAEILAQKDFGFPVSENGNRQIKDLKDKPDSTKHKPDSSTKEKPYLSPRDKPYLSPRDKPHLSPRDKPHLSPRDKPYLSPRDKSYLSPRDKEDSPTKRRPDSSTRDKRDWSPRDKRDWSPRDKRDRSPRDKKDLSPRRKSDTTRRDKPDSSRRQKADSTTKNKPESAKVEKPDLISKATTEGLSDWEFEEILRKERLNKTISLRDMIAGLQAREKYREDNNMNPSLEKILTNPKVESNAKDIVGVKCVSETKDISKLIIVQHENIDRYKKGQSFDILRHSATQCGMLLQWWQKCVYTKHPQIYKCSIWLERQFLGEGYSTSFDDSKTLAANIVLKELYPKYPVISIKGGKAPANKKTIQYKEITEKSKILMMATGEKIPPKLPKINDWIIQICKEYITEYKESDIVEVFKLTPGYTEEEISLIQSFSVAMGLRCNYQKGKSVLIHKMIDPAEVLKKLTTPGTTDKNYRFVNSKEKRKIVEKFKN